MLSTEQARRGGAGEAGPDEQSHPDRLLLPGLRAAGRAAARQPGGAGHLSCGRNWAVI